MFPAFEGALVQSGELTVSKPRKIRKLKGSHMCEVIMQGKLPLLTWRPFETTAGFFYLLEFRVLRKK